jgi:hypothetical protein
MSIEASAPIEPFFGKWPIQGFSTKIGRLRAFPEPSTNARYLRISSVAGTIGNACFGVETGPTNKRRLTGSPRSHGSRNVGVARSLGWKVQYALRQRLSA